MSSVAWLEEELESLGLKVMARTPFYGRGPGPGIARMDMQAATAPGRFAKDSLTEAGRAAGDAIETYSKNKQRSEMLDGQIGTILTNMTPEKQKEIETSPFKPQLDKFLAGEMPLSKKESFFGSLMLDMKMDEQQKQTERQDYLYNRERDALEASDEFNRFMVAPTPNQLPDDPFAPVPPPFGDAPVQRFIQTEAGQEAAKEISESGMSDQAKMQAFQSIMARETAKAPKGGYTVDIQHPDGTPHTYRMYDDGSRRYIGPAPAQGREYMSVDEQLAVHEQKGLSEANVTRLGELDKNLRASIDTAETARNALATLTRLPDDAKTGGFTESINEIQKYLNSAGFDFDPETLRRIGNTEQFMQQTGEFLFDSIADTKGSISNAEMAIFRSINPGMKQSRLGNQLMLEFIATAGERAKRKLRYKQDLEADALSSREMVRALDEFDKLPENKITQILDPIIGDGGQSASPSAPRSGARQVPQGGGVIRTNSGGEIKLIP